MGEFIVHRPRSAPKDRIELPPKVLLHDLLVGLGLVLDRGSIDTGPKIAEVLIKETTLLRHERSNRKWPRQAAPRVVGSQTLRAHRGPHEFSKGSQPTAEQSMEQAPSLDPVGERTSRSPSSSTRTHADP